MPHWRRRIEHLIAHDSSGCWVAEDDAGVVVGVVAALRREGPWGLSTYAVRPGTRARGSARGCSPGACSGRPWPATRADGPIVVGYFTSHHGWAVDIGIQAGMQVFNRGYLALRGLEPPSAYLPSGHFL